MTEVGDGQAHLLTVTHDSEVVEYQLEHLPTCKAFDTRAYLLAEDGHTVEAHAYGSSSYECALGLQIDDGGFLDVIGVTSWGPGLKHVTEHLKDGQYEVEAWVRHYPSTPNGPEEWDAGVYVTKVDVDGAEANVEVDAFEEMLDAKCPRCEHPAHDPNDCDATVGYDHLNGDHECGCPGRAS